MTGSSHGRSSPRPGVPKHPVDSQVHRRATGGATVNGPTETTTPSPDDGPPAPRPANRRGPGSRGRRTALLVGAGVMLLVALVAALTLGERWGGPPVVRSLPDTLVGLPSQHGGPAADVADGLTARLGAEPSVSDVAVQVYGEQDRIMVVLALTPSEPLTGTTAAELTAQVLGAAGPRRGTSEDFRSATTGDGRATVTCSAPRPDAATCVSVEPDSALVVLTTGMSTDPIDLIRQARDELGQDSGF